MSKKGKIVVAMSGGLDSSMSALMLHEEGYEVIGMTLKTWDYASTGGNVKETGCCSLDSINDARSVAVKCGFPHYVVDIRREFGSRVIDNFVSEYMAGRTPNPCVLCNTHIKWEALIWRAHLLGCERIATGHYARLRYDRIHERWVVSKAADETKDQSYVLWGMSRKNLARTLFPLGEFRKSEIRRMAEKAGLGHLAAKRESYELCFIPDNNYRDFLRRKIPGIDRRLAGGDFISAEGQALGKHRGYPFYTIGQRRGMELSAGKPLYVTEIRPGTNTVVLGEEEELQKKAMWVKEYNLIKYDSLPEGMDAVVKIRYRDRGTPCTLTEADGRIRVLFREPAGAIAPGQSAVFYEGDDVIGGGIIE